MEQLKRNDLVTENINLVYYVYEKLIKNDITIQNKEAIISEGMVGLVKASKYFDESKGYKFTTFAARCIRNEMLMFLRTLNRQGANEISLYTPIHKDKDDNEICLIDIIGEDIDKFEIEIDKNMFKEFISKQSLEDRKMVEALCKGYSQREISQAMRIKQPTVSRRLAKLKKKFKLNYKLCN